MLTLKIIKNYLNTSIHIGTILPGGSAFLIFLIPILILTACKTKEQSQLPEMLVLDEGWEFRQAQGDSSWMPAEVPGAVHTDLMTNGVIKDPYYRTNELDVQWVDKKDWVYKTRFDVPDSMYGRANVRLLFKGLDTYADVFLNDSLILQADNFFVAWPVDVKGLLKKNNNQLEIRFYSPTQKGLEGLEALGYGLPSNNDQSERGEMGENKVGIFLRKPGYHFGWDWGPRLVTSGIWQPVYLQAWDNLRIDEVFYEQQQVSREKAVVTAHLELRSDKEQRVTISLSHANENLVHQESVLRVGKNSIDIPFTIDNPHLWWTHNLGDPYLYDFEISVKSQNKEMDKRHTRVGLRDVKIIRKQDSVGTGFYIQLNGVPVFSKGANYIPQDMFVSGVADSRYDSLIQFARDANMNMLRVWGGGFYEKDLFYQLCDEKGIMVWQDFMFACSMYPGDSAYLDKVRHEAIYNIRRLRNHPSIVLWCGNNEIDTAWGEYEEDAGWGWKERYTHEQRKEIWQSYLKIFHDLLPNILKEEWPQAYYWPSSPYKEEGSHASYTSQSGDMHYWGVWHGMEDFEAFEAHIGRFMSEFGFQSFPEMASIRKFTQPEDRDINSTVMLSHQRAENGNARILEYMERYYRVPDNFEDFIYVGQVLQAEGMKVGLETHRRAMPFNMGSLYWQLNDCWPVASWSGIDYYMNWKALHYYVKKAFGEVLVSPHLTGDKGAVYVVSDRAEKQEATLEWSFITFAGDTLVRATKPVVITPGYSEKVWDFSLKEILGNVPRSEALLAVRLSSGDKLLSRNELYFERAKTLVLPQAVIKTETRQLSEDRISITLSSEVLAKNVYLHFKNTEGHFSDNYFDVLPGETVRVTFRPKQPLPTIPELIIKTLSDTY